MGSKGVALALSVAVLAAVSYLGPRGELCSVCGGIITEVYPWRVLDAAGRRGLRHCAEPCHEGACFEKVLEKVQA